MRMAKIDSTWSILSKWAESTMHATARSTKSTKVEFQRVRHGQLFAAFVFVFDPQESKNSCWEGSFYLTDVHHATTMFLTVTSYLFCRRI